MRYILFLVALVLLSLAAFRLASPGVYNITAVWWMMGLAVVTLIAASWQTPK